MPQRLIEHALRSEHVAVEVRTFSLRENAVVETHHDDTCFIAFTLWARPGISSGRFQELWAPTRFETMGDIVFVPNGLTMIGTGAGGPRRYFACNLAADLFGTNWAQLSEHAFVESLSLKSPDVRLGLRRLLKEAVEPELGSPLLLDAVGTLLAIDVKRHLESLKPASPRKKGGLTPVRLRRLEERLNADMAMPSLEELAVCCGLSKRHLARAFREETGRTIGEYVTLASRERACTLLNTTDLPIHAVAAQVGFSSAASFSYAFRKATGIRPSDLRKNARLLDKGARRRPTGSA
jgi:AraC family transcriptional regulator